MSELASESSTRTDRRDTVVLGAMFFGTTIDEATSFDLLDRYVDAGGVWIDTADCYSFWTSDTGFGGQSEEVLGRWLAARPGVRDRVRIATKVGCECLTPRSWPEASEGLAPDVIHKVARQSLERMRTDRLDLFFSHRDDDDVEQAETVQAFGELVADGIVRRLGNSNSALWRTERARGVAAARGLAGPTVLQQRYTYLQPRPLALAHEQNHRFGWLTDEMLDYAVHDPSVDLWAYSPLMTGAYDRPDRPIMDAFRHEGTDRRLAALASVAGELGVTRSAVVLAWMTGGTPAVHPILGVSTPEQLDIGLAGARLELPAALRQRLDDAW